MGHNTLPILSFVDGGDVVADLDRLMEFGAFIEGTSRSGKTNLVRVFLEQTYGHIQHIVLDPEGEYATLRSAERPYLVVGKGRDVELTADAGAVRRLVLALVDKSVSVIIDLSEHDTEEQHTIVAAVCDALVSLPENHPGNAAVVIEELQEYAPEGGGKTTALPSVRRLAKRGLKRGFFIIGASQRVSDVSKGVVTMLKTKMIGGTDHKDAPRALEELGLPSRDRATVTDLPQGEFWVKGPAFERHAQHVRVPRSITAPPKRKRGDPPAPAAEAPAEIAALAKALAAAAQVPEPATIAIAPAHGIRGVPSATLTRQTAVPVDRAALLARKQQQLQAARDQGRFEEAERQERYRTAVRTECNLAVVGLRDVMARFESAIAGIDERWIKPVAPDPAPPPVQHRATPRNIVQHDAPSPASGELAASARKVLTAVAHLEALGVPKPTVVQVALFNDVSHTTGSYKQNIRDLTGDGFLIRESGRVSLTGTGRAAADRVPPVKKADRLAAWCGRLSKSQAAMLRTVAARRSLSVVDLAIVLGVSHTTGSYKQNIRELRTYGLVATKGGLVSLTSFAAHGVSS